MEKNTQEPVAPPTSTPSNVDKSINTQRQTTRSGAPTWLKLSLVGVVVLVCLGLAAATFLLGRLSRPNSIENQRQTVVQEGEVISEVAEQVGPSVVSILTSQQSQRSLFYGGSQTTQAAGTGVIIDSNGLVLTNKHVVPEGVASVTVVTSEGTKYESVQVVGRDPLNDLAILKVSEPKNFKAASLANSDNVKTGQKVIAIGNALGQFQNTVTSGIISGLGRPIEAGDQNGQATEQLTNLFQTDAAINSGNSGGPLLNYNGEVVGINTAVAADAENIGFAIPINEAKGIISSVQSTGKLSRPYIGVRYITLTPAVADELNVSQEQGAYISSEGESVVSGSPADKAGLQGGDVITQVDSTKLSETTSLASALGRYKVGDTVELKIVRDGKAKTVKVTLAEAPAE